VRRREFIALLGGSAVAWPLAVRAQTADKVARVGYIGTNRDSPLGAAIYQAFLEGLRSHGFNLGRNLVVEFRPLEQDLDALSADAAELVRLDVGVLVTDGTETALQAAMGASSTLPIVMIATNFDPIERGYAKGLARPGGNVTGLFLRQTELAEKQTELLFQALPDKLRLGVLWDAISADQFGAAERRAKALGLEVHSLKLDNPPYDFAAAFHNLAEASPQMLLVLSSPHFTPSRSQIAELAIRYRLPAMFIFKTYAQAGGLLSYGADYVAMHRQAATYVAKILMGTKASDLPIEQPNKYDLVVNLKTAKAMGLELPTVILLRADEVIE
jgi:putative tryptophan/tyrosine transport system substrate-binding protein